MKHNNLFFTKTLFINKTRPREVFHQLQYAEFEFDVGLELNRHNEKVNEHIFIPSL